jgi:hypothetical protein
MTTVSSGTSQWASGVCTAFSDWQASLKDAKSTLTTGGVSEANLNQATGQAQEANQQLVRTLQNLGKPGTSDGQKATQNVNDLKTSLSFIMNKIKQTVDQKATTPAELEAELTTVKQSISTMSAALTTAVTNLKAFDPSGELEQAFNDAPSCAGYF